MVWEMACRVTFPFIFSFLSTVTILYYSIMMICQLKLYDICSISVCVHCVCTSPGFEPIQYPQGAQCGRQPAELPGGHHCLQQWHCTSGQVGNGGANGISVAQCKTAVTPVHLHWSYCNLALNHWVTQVLLITSLIQNILNRCFINCS